MKRPILIATIGYIIGIIVGLYFEKSIVLIYIPIIAIYITNKVYIRTKQRINNNLSSQTIFKPTKLKLFSIKRYIRYAKIYFNSKVIAILIISSIISNINLNFQNKNYENIRNSLARQESINNIGIVISNKEEKQYYNKYKIETIINNKKMKFYISTNKNLKLEYGDEISFNGTFQKPQEQRNYKGYDYSQHLKQIKIYGTIKCTSVKILRKQQGNKIFLISNKISNRVIENVKRVLKEQEAPILLGVMLGDKNDIDSEMQDNFRNASMSHILAVSGMHISYIVLGLTRIGKKLIGKRYTEILSIFILIFYMLITNFTPSVTRAGIMSILMISSKLFYRKNDILTSVSIALLFTLIYNPFLIQNLGFQLSYGGVLGIVLFNKSILKILKSINIKNKIYKYKIRPKIKKQLDKVIEIISISISVQLFIIPIILYNLNTLNLYFLISNLILSVFIGPVIIIGFLFITIALINLKIASFFLGVVELCIKILTTISQIGKIPFSKIYISTPNIFSILNYYLVIGITLLTFYIYLAKKTNKTQIRTRNLIALIKIKLRENKNRLKKIFIILIFIIVFLHFCPKDLKIYFIDVGQGDSTFIVTPKNKTILIDGGGSLNSNIDIGKNTLLPYILDRGFTQIDTIIISHFDSDHVRFYAIFIARNKSKKYHYRKTIQKFS